MYIDVPQHALLTKGPHYTPIHVLRKHHRIHHLSTYRTLANVHEYLDGIHFLKQSYMVQFDPKLLNDNGEVPKTEWSGWRFDSHL